MFIGVYLWLVFNLRFRFLSRTHGAFCELALQGARVHAEAARGFGNVAAAFREYFLDMLPFEPRERQRLRLHRHRGVAAVTLEDGDDLVGIRRELALLIRLTAGFFLIGPLTCCVQDLPAA